MTKKGIALLVVLALLASSLSIISVKAAGTSCLGGLWHFDEGVGSLAYDVSGYDNHGAICGGAIWTDGKFGKALDFDGIDNYVDVPDSPSLDITGKITLEAWIYPRSMTQLQVIVAKYNHSSLNSSYYLGLGGYGYMNKILFALSYNGNNFYYMLSNTNITENTWTHVAAASNATHMALYINGIKDNVRTYPPGVIYAGTANLRISCYLPEQGFPRFFDGIIDEVRVSVGVIWTVDDDRFQCPNADFTTIQEAIDEASSCDTIVVHDGTYEGALYINKNLTIKAASTPVITGSQLFATDFGNREAVIFVENAANVVLEGFDVEGSGLGPVKSYGILYENSGGTVKQCVVSPNTVGDMNSAGIASWSNSTLRIENCTIHDFGRIGIYSNNATMTIVGNKVIGQVYSLDDQVNYGIEIEDYSGPSMAGIEGNEIYNCSNTHPSPLWSSGAIIVDTWREWADYYNLALLPSKVSITYNTIHDNYEAIEIVSNEFSYAHYNSFSDNLYGVWSAPENWTTNPTYYVFDACYNWWGDASGPCHETSWMYMGQPYGPHYGSGDDVGDYVLYYPWLNAPSGDPVEPPMASFTCTPPEPKVGEEAEFDASTSAPNGGTIIEYLWDFGDGNVTLTTDPILTHVFGSVSAYNVTLTVKDSEGLSDSTWQTVNVVPALTHDVAVTGVTTSADHACQGWLVGIDVTVANLGEAAENFTVTVYYDGNVIALQSVYLEPNATSVLSFVWNTTGVPYCHNYTISAYATPVLYETELTNNTCIDGGVKIHIAGDTNGDGIIDYRDISQVAMAFGTTPGHQRWNPDCDLNRDGLIDMKDAFIVAKRFGQTC